MVSFLLARLVVTVMLVQPSAFRVSLPFLSMVAALLLEEAQVTSLLAVSSGSKVAERVRVPLPRPTTKPSSSSSSASVTMDTPVGRVSSTMCSLTWAVLLPFLVVAVMVTSPALRNFTTPFATVAVLVSLDFQVTSLTPLWGSRCHSISKLPSERITSSSSSVCSMMAVGSTGVSSTVDTLVLKPTLTYPLSP